MNKTPLNLSHILSWSVFLFWTGVFAIYFFSGDYVMFLNPRLGWLPLMAFILNLIFFVALLFSGNLRRYHHHHHHHQRGKIDPVRLLILLVPVIFVAGLKSGDLGSYAFKKRTVNLAGIETNARIKAPGVEMVGDLNTHQMLVASAAARLPAQVSLIDIHADFEKLLGKNVLTRGMYVEDSPGLPEGTFVVCRFVMVCCIADARPVAVLVRGNKPPQMKNENWIEVEGVLEKTVLQGHPAAVIRAERIEPARKPENPYLIPRMR